MSEPSRVPGAGAGTLAEAVDLGLGQFRREAIEELSDLLAKRTWPSLDAFIFASRRPLRTVVLSLIEIEAKTPGALDGAFDAAGAHRFGRAPQGFPASLAAAYIRAAAERPSPALMWGQRRLTAQAAMERARYVCDHLPSGSGPALFIGDDDLVSPLVAALAPQREVLACDIDSLVLEEVERVASALGASVKTTCLDLRDAAAFEELGAEAAITDPYPSRDGSFEGFFWSAAVASLRADGLLISTKAPSHKPRSYALGAESSLAALGLEVIDIRADQGRYEVFDFELASLEKDFLAQAGLTPEISHTKDAFLARSGPSATRGELARFDYEEWQTAIDHHYLTDFARLAGHEARYEGSACVRRELEEPKLEMLWALAHESWTRHAPRPEGSF